MEPQSKKTVLIAEDERSFVMAIKLELEKTGYDVSWGSTGAEAMEVLKQRPVDLVLLDIMMPVKNGFEVLAEMRADDKLKNIPVLVVSNLGQEADAERALSLGAKEYIVKADTSIHELIRKVRTIVPI